MDPPPPSLLLLARPDLRSGGFFSDYKRKGRGPDCRLLTPLPPLNPLFLPGNLRETLPGCSCYDFCRVCGCKFLVQYGDFKRRVSSENLYDEPNLRNAASMIFSANWGFSSEQFSSPSSRIWEECARNITSETELIRFLRGKSQRTTRRATKLFDEIS